jgi:hypothetical protein
MPTWPRFTATYLPSPSTPLIALIVGGVMVGIGQFMVYDAMIKLSQSNETNGRYDTFYLVSTGYPFRSYGLILFAIGGIGFVVRNLGSQRLQSTFAFGFWISLIAAAGHLALINARLFKMPRRYNDYPDYHWLMNVTFSVLSVISLLGLALVALSVIGAIGQRLLNKAR